MEQIYLVLDSNGIPIAQAVLESPANADVMQLRILQGSADTVTARRDVQLIGMDDRAQARRGLVIRQRGDQLRRRGLLHRGQPHREGGGGAGASGDG